MKGPRFFIRPDSVRENRVTLEPAESRHAISVLRLRRGDAVRLFDGEGREYGGAVEGIQKDRLTVAVNERAVAEAPSPAITLAVSVIKPERMELLIEKASELGVSSVVPLVTERSVVRLARERREAKIARWQKIALESCKQCGQARVPRIGPVEPFASFVDGIGKYDAAFIPSLVVGGMGLGEALKKSRPKSVLVMVGPEGDFTEAEVRRAAGQGALPVSLGPLVMRSETAAIYLLSVLNFCYRNLS